MAEVLRSVLPAAGRYRGGAPLPKYVVKATQAIHQRRDRPGAQDGQATISAARRKPWPELSHVSTRLSANLSSVSSDFL